jgi:hypothetical protein
MRFMGLMKADKDSEAGTLPSREIFEKMGALMEEVTKAGVLLATDGLKPSSQATKVRVSGEKVTVTDGPFAETKELIASYALFDVKSMEEAVDWTTRFLKVLGEGEVIIYPVFEASDFPPELFSPEEAAREEKWREEMQKNTERQ